jgi:hypothetical protein
MTDAVTSLVHREQTPEDREAALEDPRPGLWAGELGADLRELTQDLTDVLIRHELLKRAEDADWAELDRAFGKLPRVRFVVDGLDVRAAVQRGGIDSDPLVRVLAWRAWGHRDRRWFELRGVRRGEELVEHHWGLVELRRGKEQWYAYALADGRPGQRIEADYGSLGIATVKIGDRPRNESDQ